jgi:hypothetical protein
VSHINTTTLILDEHRSSSEARSQYEMKSENALSITVDEFERKKKLCLSLDQPSLKGDIIGCSMDSASPTQVKISLYAEGGGVLILEVRNYDKNHYVGISGSPTKVLSGQNLINKLSEKNENRVEQVSKKLNCTRVEAICVVSFGLIQSVFRKNLEVDFFNAEEWEKIRTREVSVFSLGFASYVKLGESESEAKKSLGLLASLASATVTVSALDEDGDNRRLVHQQLISLYDGTLSAELKGMKTQKSGYDGTSVSVVLKKTDNSRSLICSQTFYNKDVEVEDNKDLYTGKGNSEQKKILSDADLERLKTHVRVDNVFYAPYLSSWLAASVPKGTVLESTGKSILLKEIAPLYDQPLLVHAMIDYMRSELGVRALALSPTITGIRTLCSKLPASIGKELKRWTDDSSLTAKTSKRGLLVDYDFSKLQLSYETLELMMTKYYLDLRAPFDFYVHLDSIRSRYLLDYTDVRNLALYSSGHEVSTEVIKAIHTKMRASSLEVLSALRSNLVIGNNLQAKRAFLKESIKL